MEPEEVNEVLKTNKEHISYLSYIIIDYYLTLNEKRSAYKADFSFRIEIDVPYVPSLVIAKFAPCAYTGHRGCLFSQLIYKLVIHLSLIKMEILDLNQNLC